MKDILQHLFEYKTLNKEDARKVLIKMSQNKVNEAQLAALSVIYNMRPPTLQEIEGFRQALLELSLKIDITEFNAIDIVGTGGDKKNTFNISTLACFIVAGTGEKVIKHGNYSSSSVTGSSNILEKMGYIFTNDENVLKNQLEKAGICYLHAPLFHPLLKKTIKVRKNLKIKTFFNMLGPLLNPSNPTNIFLGVNDLQVARLYYYLYQQTNNKYAIIHSIDGYDEISLTADFKCYTPYGESIFSPETLGKKRIHCKEIIGGKNTEENKHIFINIISGNGTLSQNNVVLTNAAFALGILNNKSFKDNYEIVKYSLESGKAKIVLKRFLEN